MGRRTHSTWRPDGGRAWTLDEASRAYARENTHRFLDAPEEQESRTYTDVAGERREVISRRPILRCRDCRRFLFVTMDGRPWGPAVREMCRVEARQLPLGLAVPDG